MLAAGMDDFLADFHSLADLRPRLRHWVRLAIHSRSALNASGNGTDSSPAR